MPLKTKSSSDKTVNWVLRFELLYNYHSVVIIFIIQKDVEALNVPIILILKRNIWCTNDIDLIAFSLLLYVLKLVKYLLKIYNICIFLSSANYYFFLHQSHQYADLLEWGYLTLLISNTFRWFHFVTNVKHFITY